MKTIKSTIPIIAQTAYSTEAERVKAINSGCSGFITKPINKSELTELINVYVVKE